jgi:integrase
VRLSNFYRRHYQPLVKRAGLEGVTFHALRHTSATLLLASGADVKSAQAVRGHAKASHTLDICADFVLDSVGDAMERLGNAIKTGAL